MSFQAADLPLLLYLLLTAVAGYYLLRALRCAPWWHLRDSRDSHVLLGGTVGVLLMWSMQAGFDNQLALHLLGATLLTLMFGWAFAMLALLLVVAGSTLAGALEWPALPVNWLMLGILPVLASHAIYRFVDRRLPNHFFVYIFLNAFFGAAITMGLVGLATSALHWAAGMETEYLLHNYLRYFLLLLFPEAFLTGMLMTIFVVYRPHWVSTFDDERYLRRR